MNDAILRIGSISIYGFGVLSVFAFLWGSFVFYKKALESHFDDFAVLDAVVLSALWGLIVGRATFVLTSITTFWNHFPRLFLLTDYPGLNKWGIILGISLGTYLSVRKIKAKFFDWFDFVALGITSGMSIFYGGLSLLGSSWQYFVLSVLLLVVFIVLWKIEHSYRMFSWYRNKKTSAKSGLICGFSISGWGLLSIVEAALFWKFAVVRVILGCLLFVGGLVLVYIRSGRTVSEDIKIIFKNGKRQ